jgi:hypothetical protein
MKCYVITLEAEERILKIIANIKNQIYNKISNFIFYELNEETEELSKTTSFPIN